MSDFAPSAYYWITNTVADTAKLAKLARLASTTPPLHAVESFITALSASSDGASPMPLNMSRVLT